MNKRVLITGGAGFQGSNLSRRLLQKGYEVTILNTLSKVSEKNVERFNLEKANIVWGSITDNNVVEKTIRDVDLVIHMAANIHVDDSIVNPKKYFEVNVLGTNNVLEYVRKLNIPMIHISSCEVYGYQENILTEKSPFCANSPYASSKAGADIECYAYNKTYGVDVTILRPSNVYGVGQRSGKRGAVISIWLNSALNNEDIYIYGDGSQTREFIYVDDLVDVYEKFVELKLKEKDLFAGEVFNIGTNQQIAMKDLAKKMLKILGRNSVSKIRHIQERPGEVKKFVLDSSKIMKTLFWKPKVSMEEGLENLIFQMEDNV